VSSVAEPTQESDTQATSTVDTHVDSEMNLLVAAVDVDAAQARNLRQDVPVMTIQDSLVLPENPEIADASMADTAGMDADMLADEDPMLNLVGF
ncbi:MAG: hypothetical protein KTR14_10430, partial [Vampirovibrio sp.]|nr:hypothetical protein [Vampirovibrio sp.]